MSTDGNAKWCALDPRAGTALVVAESALNVACVGARPVALVNCLNFGNPEHPEVMWQLSEAIDGMADACRALSIPVIGGNVSLYNESRGRDIDPTPVVGTLGLVERLERRPARRRRWSEGSTILLVGAVGDLAQPGSLAGSRWAVERARPPRRPASRRWIWRSTSGWCGWWRSWSWSGLVDGVHDVSEGGLGVALAEMAVSSGVGFTLEGVADHAGLFGEEPSRVVFSVPDSALADVERRVRSAGLGSARIGLAGGDRLVVAGLVDVALADADAAWRGSLPSALGVG